MSKTIIETMSSIREKMRDKGGDMPMVNMGEAAEDIQSAGRKAADDAGAGGADDGHNGKIQ